MGLFFYTKKGSVISTVDLPTTEIIEPDMLETVFKKGWSQKDDWVIDSWCLDWYDCW